MNLEIFDRFSKNAQVSRSVKICPEGVNLFNADERACGQTDDETSSRFLQFWESTKKNPSTFITDAINALFVSHCRLLAQFFCWYSLRGVA